VAKYGNPPIQEAVQLKPQENRIDPQLAVSPDTYIAQQVIPSGSLNGDIVVPPDTVNIQNVVPSRPVNPDIVIAQDTVNIQSINPPNQVDTDIPIAPDTVNIQIPQSAQINPDIIIPEETPRTTLEQRFGGQWIPSEDALNIGIENYSELENFRYKGTSLEGVGGFTIRATDTAVGVTNGIQHVSSYDDNSLVVQTINDSDSARHIKQLQLDGFAVYAPHTVLDIYKKVGSTWSVGNVAITAGVYSPTEMAAEIVTRVNAALGITVTCTYSTTTNKFTITKTVGTIDGIKILVNTSTYDTGFAKLIGFTADQTDEAGTLELVSDTACVFNGYDTWTDLYTENASAGLARMAVLPRETIGICDGMDNLVWSGDRMPVGAFLVGQFGTNAVKASANNNDLEFTSSEGTATIAVPDKDDYTMDEYAQAIEDAMNGSSTLTGTGTIDFTVNGGCGKLVIEASTGTIAKTLNGDGTGTAGFLRAATATSKIYAQAFAIVGYPYWRGGINGDGLHDKTTIMSNDLTDSENIWEVLSSTTHNYFMVGSTRQLSGVYFTINGTDVNEAVSTMSCKYFDGEKLVEFQNFTDGTITGTNPNFVSLGQSGEYEFTSAAEIALAKPMYLNGHMLYFYMFEITAVSGNPKLKRVDAVAGAQEVGDLWSTEFIYPIYCEYNTGGTTLNAKTGKNYTLEARQESYSSQTGGYVFPKEGFSNDSPYTNIINLIFEHPITALKLRLFSKEAGTQAGYIVVRYSAPIAGVVITDPFTETIVYYNETGVQSQMVEDGVVAWNQPTTIRKTTYNGITGYVYQLYWNDSSGYYNFSSELQIDTIAGIPAPRTLDKPYTFPFSFQNRAMWCGSISDKELNRIDYSASNAPDVYNGTDSSGYDNIRSLYIGGRDALTGAVELYNQLGQEVQTVALLYKNTETYLLAGNTPDTFMVYKVSDNIGCPAPLTIATAEVAFQTQNGRPENLAIWLSDKSPVMFVGNSIYPIRGVEPYFDPSNSLCINRNYIHVARGWFDSTYNEYNLLIPSGVGQTTNNLWLVLDVVRMRWYVKEPTVYPAGAFPSEDANGFKLEYGHTTTGELLQLEDGLYWSGTNKITNTVTTSDILPLKTSWAESLITRFKALFKTNTEGTLTVNHYANGSTTATASSNLPSDKTMADSGYRTRNLINNVNLTGLSHKFEFITEDCTVTKPTLIGWGAVVQEHREDVIDKAYKS